MNFRGIIKLLLCTNVIGSSHCDPSTKYQCTGEDVTFTWSHNASDSFLVKQLEKLPDEQIMWLHNKSGKYQHEEYKDYKNRTVILDATPTSTSIQLKNVTQADSGKYQLRVDGSVTAKNTDTLQVFKKSDLRPIIRINTDDVFPGESRVNLTDRNVTIFIPPHKDLKANIVITTCTENKSMLCHKNCIYVSPDIVENECNASIYVDYGICDVFPFFVLMDLPHIVYPSPFVASNVGVAIAWSITILIILIILTLIAILCVLRVAKKSQEERSPREKLYFQYAERIPCCSKVISRNTEIEYTKDKSQNRSDVKFQQLNENDEEDILRKTDETFHPGESHLDNSSEASVPDSILIKTESEHSGNAISNEQPLDILPKKSTELSILLTKDETSKQDPSLETHLSSQPEPEFCKTPQLPMPNDEEESLHKLDSDKSDVQDSPTPSLQTVGSRPVFKNERQIRSTAKKNAEPKKKKRSKSDVLDENEPKTQEEYLLSLNPITPDSKPKNIHKYRDPVLKNDDNDATDTGNNKDVSLLETADNQPVPDLDELAELLEGKLTIRDDNNKEEKRKEKAPVLQPATLSEGLNPIFAGQQQQTTDTIVDDDEDMAEADNDSSVHRYPPSVSENVPVSTISHYPCQEDSPEGGLFV